MFSTYIKYKWAESTLSIQERAFLKDVFTNNTLPVYIAVSGWPDSMWLAQVIFDTFLTNSLDMSRLVILYMDHRTEHMPSLYDWCCRYFADLQVIGCSLLPLPRPSETKRRKSRKAFFENHLHRTGGILCTGHTLTDRIETTFLNLERWCRLRWLLNMQFHNKHNTATYLRPLLTLPKYLTQQYCTTYSIPYRIDPTNKHTSFTKRNLIRARFQTEYIPQHVVQQRNNMYTYGEHIFNTYIPICTPVSITTSQGNITWFSTKLPQSRHELSCLLSIQKLYSWVSQAFLDELFTFLTTAHSGYRYVRGWWICLAFKKLYFFPATSKTPFWKTMQKLPVWISLLRDSRLPQSGDRYHGKFFSKWLSKKWVPFFVRPFVPVVAEGREIISFEITGIVKCL